MEKHQIILSEEEIQSICKRIGTELTTDLKDDERTPLFLGVMKGALNFMMDVLKRVEIPILTDFIQLSSYSGTSTTGRIILKKNFDMDIKGRTVVIVEDVIDTGISMSYLIKYLHENYKPKRILLCALFDKSYARKENIHIDYVGKVLSENTFLCGYGLDYNELERNLPYVYGATAKDVQYLDGLLAK